MKKKSVIFLSLISLIVVTLIVVALVRYFTNSTFVEVPTYPGAQQLNVQVQDNGQTRITTFQVNDYLIAAKLTYSSMFDKAGWFQTTITAHGGRYMFIDESKSIEILGATLVRNRCPAYIVETNAEEFDYHQIRFTVIQKIGACGSTFK